jgi:hypothetical protein
MPISYDHKILFIHVPKCAGTSVEGILNCKDEDKFYTESLTSRTLASLPINSFTGREYRICASKNKQHYTYRELIKILPKNIIEDFEKIAIVRNPYDRLVSEYYYSAYSIKSHKNFEAFVKTALKLDLYTRNWLYDGHLETQTSYLINEQKNFNSINKIFKFEEINTCFDYLNKIIGKVCRPHLRAASNRKPYSEYYTSELKEIVYNFYKDDFTNFNYSV